MRRYKDMTSDEKNVVKQHIQLYGGLLLIFVVIAVFLRIYNTRLIQGDGILPTPRKAVDPIGVTYYAQDDPRWAGDALGQTGYTMQEEGSLFAALAMVLDSDGIIQAIELAPTVWSNRSIRWLTTSRPSASTLSMTRSAAKTPPWPKTAAGRLSTCSRTRRLALGLDPHNPNKHICC